MSWKWRIEKEIEKKFSVKLERENGKLTIKSDDCSITNEIIDYLIQQNSEMQTELIELRNKRNTSSTEKKTKIDKRVDFV